MGLRGQAERNSNWQSARRRLLSGYIDWLEDHRIQLPTTLSKMDVADVNDVIPDIPIALRKGKRRSSVLLSPNKPRLDIDNAAAQSTATTPARRSKRVRFSGSALPSNTNPLATGITPHLRRATLGTPKSRRRSTPARSEQTDDLQFTPFKQVLDERVKRRIRRNGLSEEMNDFEAERKTKESLKKEIEDKDAELQQLRAELENARSVAAQEELLIAPPASQQRVDEVEAELEALRQSFALEESRPVEAWTHVPRGLQGPRSEGGDTILIYEDDDALQESCVNADPESLAMGLELEAARQAKQSMLGSFRESSSIHDTAIAFADSPARRKAQGVGQSPKTPRTFYHDMCKQLKTTTNRAEDAELALQTLENEILSLGFVDSQQNASEAIAAILDHFRQARIELERAVPGETVIGFENAKVLPELIKKLKTIADQLRSKEYDLKAARDQHHNLKGNFEKAIVAAEKANARIKDLESAVDSQAEDMLGVRIRAQQLEKSLEEKEHDMESLAAALNKYRDDVSRLETLISQLEQDHETSLSSSASEHAQAISDLDAKVAAETRGRRAAEQSAVSRLAKINELELSLSTTRQHANDLEVQITGLQSQISSGTTLHSQELGSLNTRISTLSTALTHANAEVSKLRHIKFKLESRLRDEVENGARAVEAIQADLIRSVAKTNEDKKKYIRGAKVRIANWEMELEDESGEDASSSVAGPMTPSSLVRFADLAEEIEFTAGGRVSSGSEDDAASEHIPGSVEMSRGRSRKPRSMDRAPKGLALGLKTSKPSSRYQRDSGIGMSPVSEVELKAAFEADDEPRGLMTPDLSSDADYFEQERESVEVDMV